MSLHLGGCSSLEFWLTEWVMFWGPCLINDIWEASVSQFCVVAAWLEQIGVKGSAGGRGDEGGTWRMTGHVKAVRNTSQQNPL